MAQTLTLPDNVAALTAQWHRDLETLRAAKDVDALRHHEHEYAMSAVQFLTDHIAIPDLAVSDRKLTAALVFAALSQHASRLIKELTAAPKILRRPVDVTEQLAERDL